MLYPENRFLFTMKDICHACGVSRTTLIRMEESGFITPYRIDETTGYRYYDADNIAQIGQYRILQEIGLSRNEITDIYFRNFDAQAFIKEQQDKINRLQQSLNKLELIYTKNKDLTFSYTELSEVTCYCVTTSMDKFSKMETDAFELYQQIIKDGFQINGTEPLFAYIPTDISKQNKKNKSEVMVSICIPIHAKDFHSPNVKTFPGCRAFSLVGYGDYAIIPELRIKFNEEVSRRGLKPTGPLRVIMRVAAYSGAHISNNDYCFEYVLPIE